MMKEETKKKLYVIAMPSIIAAMVLIIGIVLMTNGADIVFSVDKTLGMVVLTTGCILGIGALLYWDIATSIAIFRKELNDMKKEG